MFCPKVAPPRVTKRGDCEFTPPWRRGACPPRVAAGPGRLGTGACACPALYRLRPRCGRGQLRDAKGLLSNSATSASLIGPPCRESVWTEALESLPK